MTSRYEQALSDHSYLWKEYGPAADMTGAYVDQHDLAKLLKSPTRATATKCLIAQIHYWYQAGPDPAMQASGIQHDQRLIEIQERYGCVVMF